MKMQNPTVVKFDAAKAQVVSCPKEFQPKPKEPFLYVLCDSLTPSAPIYIGEYGRSSSYNVVERVRRHFNSTGSSTMNRVYKNMAAFGLRMPPIVVAYFFELESKFQGKAERESLEAWVIREFCHVNRAQDERFCVSKYSAPVVNYKREAQCIYNLVAACA